MLGSKQIYLKLYSKEFIEVFHNPKLISAWGNFQKHHATATLLPLRLICARGLPDQGRTPKDEGNRHKPRPLQMKNLGEQRAIPTTLMKSRTHWLQSFMAMFPWNWHHTSETSGSRGCDSGRLYHTPAKPQTSAGVSPQPPHAFSFPVSYPSHFPCVVLWGFFTLYDHIFQFSNMSRCRMF